MKKREPLGRPLGRWTLIVATIGLAAVGWAYLLAYPAAAAEEVEAAAADTSSAPPEESAPAAAQEPEASSEPAQEAPEAPEESAADTAVDKRLVDIHGSVDTGIDALWDDDGSDVNLDQTLRLRLDFPRYPRYHVRGALWTHWDLDSDESRSSVLRDINDAYDSDLRARLLQLRLDVDDLWGESVLRIGRQRIQEAPTFNRIDGLYYKQKYDRWDWYTFFGARASVYQDTHEDLAYGGGVSVRLTDWTRAAVDVYYGEESRGEGDEVYRPLYVEWLDWPYPRRVREDLGNNQWSFSLWQQVTPSVQLFGRYNLVDGEGDEIILDLTGYVTSWDLTYHAAYRARLDEAGDRVNDLSTFYRTLGPYEEYDNVLLSVHKGLGERFGVSLEAEFHNTDDSRLYTGNRDYDRYGLIFSATKLPRDIDASIALERWDADDGEDAWTVTGEATKRWERIHLTLGADYERYEDVYIGYNPYPNFIDQALVTFLPGYYAGYRPLIWLIDQPRYEIREDIHSIYGKLKYIVNENQDLTARLRFEEDDGPDSPYWRFQMDYSFRF